MEDRFVTAAGLRSRYWEVGEGPSLLLLHGLGDSCHVWLRVIPELAHGRRVLAVDLPGFGLSEQPSRPSLPLFREWLCQFLEAAQANPCALVGHSMGGLAALDFALAHPERLSHLVLVGSIGLGHRVAWTLRLLSVPLLGELIFQPSEGRVRRTYRWCVLDPSSIPEDLVKATTRYVTQPGAKGFVLRVVRMGLRPWGLSPPYIYRSRLRELSLPTLLIWGQQDAVVPVQEAIAANAAVPALRLAVIPGCGHIPQLEHSARFAQILRDFFCQKAETATTAGGPGLSLSP